MEQTTTITTPDFEQVESAYRRIRSHVLRTPVMSSPTLDQELGCRLFCKCENLQGMGAFKIRGATNAVLRLREQGIAADVATHSSGNHGAALAAAAAMDGRRAVVVMPDDCVNAKVNNVRRQGGEVRFCAATHKAREEGLDRLVERGMIPIHPYDHPDIISGQGTAALEMLKQQPDIEILLAPVGGGGLIAGCAIVASHLRPGMEVIAAEPLGAADTAESMRLGERVLHFKPETIADGLRALVGKLTFPIIRDLVDEVITVREDSLLEGMALVRDHLDMLIEPSSATVIAAILEQPERFAGRRIGAVITGGNVELDAFPSMADESS